MIGFFIDRPIFASVLAIVIVLLGSLSLYGLPVERFPTITPPRVQLSAGYPGADAETVADSVTTPLEESINGVEGMIYMESSSSNSGGSSIAITFDVDTDVDIATVAVENRMQSALAVLPESVRRSGVSVRKRSGSMALIVNLLSPDNSLGDVELGDYAETHVADALRRVKGVGNISVLGARHYAMRVWLDPARMAARGLVPGDVVAAIEAQNLQASAGLLGAAPAPAGQGFVYQLSARGRLETAEEFGNIIIRTGDAGALLRLRDVARVELGAAGYNWYSRFNGQETAAVGVFQLPGANALEVAAGVRAEMERMAENFPPGIDYDIAYDTTVFVENAIAAVAETLRDAILLVFVVMFLFLRNWRVTVIPLIAIPVSLIGTLAVMLVLGLSINMLSLLGMVLAVGLVVDDAIVVVENVERRLAMGAENVRQAARAAMAEVTPPIIATTAILMVVFVPVAFMPGVTGRLYNHFALTIAIAVAISAFNSLTLSPALCGVFLGHRGEGRVSFLAWAERGFNRLQEVYGRLVAAAIRRRFLVFGIFAAGVMMVVVLAERIPVSFLPEEDQGVFIVAATLPPGSSLERTRAVSTRINNIVRKIPGVRAVVSIGGYNLLDGSAASNTAAAFVVLDSWEDRAKRGGEDLKTILETAWARFSQIDEALVVPLNAPAVQGLGVTGGLTMQIQDLNDAGAGAMAQAVTAVIAAAGESPALGRLLTSYSADTPQYDFDFDRAKAAALGVDVGDIFQTLQVALGSYYVNDFNRNGRAYKVIVQAEGTARAEAGDALALHVRNESGDMVPLAALAGMRLATGANTVYHYNLYRSAAITGSVTPGYSSGEAIAALAAAARESLPEGFSFAWSGVTYQEIAAAGAVPVIFMLAVVFSYLFLAALYESWMLPFAILLPVPLAILGALATLSATGLGLNVYSQIGLVMLIGLAAKNAILIVEFARRRRNAGESLEAAARGAAHDRLRPILMTAFAFILGVTPLFLSGGAAAAARTSIGVTVFSGMLAATLLSVVMVPVFYLAVQGLADRITARFSRNREAAAA